VSGGDFESGAPKGSPRREAGPEAQCESEGPGGQRKGKGVRNEWMDDFGGVNQVGELMNGSCLYRHTTTTSGWLVSASITMPHVYLSHIPSP
jgi:hypothetical protein